MRIGWSVLLSGEFRDLVGKSREWFLGCEDELYNYTALGLVFRPIQYIRCGKFSLYVLSERHDMVCGALALIWRSVVELGSEGRSRWPKAEISTYELRGLCGDKYRMAASRYYLWYCSYTGLY